MNDFVKFIKNLDWDLKQEIIEDKNSEFRYPIGICNDIKIHFIPLSSFLYVSLRMTSGPIPNPARQPSTDDALGVTNKLNFKNFIKLMI